MTPSEREILAQKIAAAFAKLADHKDEIQLLWHEFFILKPEESIMGCKNKTEFCETILGRTVRTINYMLNGGNGNRKEIVSPARLPFWERLYYKLNVCVPSISDGEEHVLIQMLNEALNTPVLTEADKTYRTCVLQNLQEASSLFIQYAKKMEATPC